MLKQLSKFWALFSLVLLLGCVLFLRLFLLDRVPGLSGDEALAGIRAYQILQGHVSLAGLVPYTGGLYEYALAPFLALFGNTLFGLRFFPAIMGALTILAVYGSFRRDYDDSLAFWGALALGTSPMMVGYNRFAVDNYPFLFSFPILILILLDRSRERPFLLIPGFFLLGLLVWCHFLGIAVLLPWLLVFPFILIGGRPVPWRLIAIGCVVMLLPIAPRVKEIFQYRELFIPLGSSIDPLKLFLSVLQDLPNLLWMGYRILDGTLIFFRFTGELTIKSVPFAPLLALGALVMSFWMKTSPITRLTLFLYIGVLIGIRVLAPYYSIRYMVIPHLILWYLAIRWLCEMGKGWRRLRIIAMFILVIMTGYQIFQVGVNYFHTFSRTGGLPILFALDPHNRHYENSVHMMENRSLYDRLCKESRVPFSNRRVFADPNLASALRFYDLNQGCLDLISLDQRISPRQGDWVVLYRITQWRDDRAFLKSLQNMELEYKEMERLSDLKYRVLEISPL